MVQKLTTAHQGVKAFQTRLTLFFNEIEEALFIKGNLVKFVDVFSK